MIALGRATESLAAIDSDGRIGAEALRKQCERYMELLAISSDDLLDCSYSDMLLAGGKK